MTYNRKDLAVKVDIKSIKGYTMREIGALDERIKRLEYYTVLNALELDAKTLSIRDDTGNLERFKNGIFADPFNDFSIGNKTDREFRIGIDSQKSMARPLFDELFHNFKLSIESSSHIKVAGRLAMIDYDHEFFGGNKYATNYRNCTESYYNYKGTVQLFPNFDNKNQVTEVAPQTITVDLASAFQKFVDVTGIGKDISTVVGDAKIIASSTSDTIIARRADLPNYSLHDVATSTSYSQTSTTTVKDLLVDMKPVNFDMGQYVKDAATMAYMRSRIISVVVRGLKPNTRLYMYFDRINITAECAPAYVTDIYATAETDKFLRQIDNTKITALVGGKENEILTQSGNRGDPISSNSRGEAYFVFLLPQNTFRAGDRTMVITNTDNIDAVAAQLTHAEGTYTSSALAISTSSLSFNVLQPTFTPTTLVTANTKTWETTTHTQYQVDPVAETFVINQTNNVSVPGVYLTQFGVYFKKKSPTVGVSCVVVGTTVGIPDKDKILGRAFLSPSNITVSDNASSETIFTFQSPILLQSDQTYAFWIEPDGANPDYEIWYSEPGFKDVLTQVDINQQPYSGVMYVSSNGTSWTAVQSQDLKFKLYRAKFKYQDATAVFRNETDEFITLSAISREATGRSVFVGDVVYAANTADTTQTFTDTAVYPFGIVEAVDELNGVLYLEKSNGLFNTETYPNLKIYRVAEIGNTAQIIYSNLIANCTIATIDDMPYHGCVPKFNVIEPLGTKLKMTFAGTANNSYGFVKDTELITVKNEGLVLYNDYERTLRSYSNEVAAGTYGTGGTATFNINMKSTSDYISPVIDLGAKSFNFIKNIVNTDASKEHTRYGNAYNRYISKRVVLAQEAEDLNVYVTGYRPVGTDIIVYGKFLNKNDNDNFDNKNWTEMTLKKELQGSFGSPQDLNDYREYIYEMPKGRLPSGDERYALNAYLDPNSIDPIYVLTYVDSLGEIYTGYNMFAIKIVLLSNNPVVLPTMRDVRAVALQR
jgi:hypothetical protein